MASVLYFSANDGVGGYELWRSDGTDAGTVLVKELGPGAESSFPVWLTNVQGRLTFTAQTPAFGQELWRSDGTSSGTLLLADVASGPISSLPEELMRVGGQLYFTAWVGSAGRELWALTLLNTISIGDATAVEGNGTAVTVTLTVRLSTPSSVPVTVDYATADGSATAPDDYTPASGTLTFAPGVTSQTVSVTVNGDTDAESDESFLLQLANAVNASIGDAESRVTLLDDDTALGYHAITPCRLVDTRGAEGPTGVPALAANSHRAFPVLGRCGVTQAARALVVTLTAVNPGDRGDLRVYPAATVAPATSVLNFTAGRTRAGMAVVMLGPEGVSVRCDMTPGSTATTHVVLDLWGYFE